MEAAYGIGVRNRYALFLEDDSSDPFTLMNNAVVSSTSSNENHHHSQQQNQNQSESFSSKKGGSHSQNKSNHHQQQQQQSSNKTGGFVQSSSSKQSTPNNATNQNKSSALSESKPNVMANQKSEGGRSNRGPRSGQQSRGSNAASGGNSGNRENQENRAQRSPRNPESKEDGDFKNSKELRGEKVENRRNGFTRGGRSGDRGGRFHNKREYNRHSGSDRSGVKSTEKREGGGPHNWGKIDDFNDQAETGLTNGTGKANEHDKTLDESYNENEEQGSGGDNEHVENEPKSDEPQLKTLDEYKREMEEKRVHTQFNIRKAGEGEDKTKWKKTYVLKKKPIVEEEEVEYEEIEEEDTTKRRNRQVLDIEVGFRPAEGGREVFRRGRGGPGRAGGRRNDSNRASTGNNPSNGSHRGGGGSQGGRGSGRSGRDRNRFQPAPKFDDPNDFPSLSSQK
ncbi:hypothetical protein SSS_10269 [Sarcoptes scabiei]|nr:hypothetical protein SSS_10269 [Sarcoptes scabiei]